MEDPLRRVYALSEVQAFPPVGTLVPHRSPMLFLNGVIACSESTTTCLATVGASSPAVREGVVASPWAIELVAQSVAAFAGVRAISSNAAPLRGFIVSCREAVFEVAQLPIETLLRIDVERFSGDVNMGLFRGIVRVASLSADVLARVELGVVLEEPGDVSGVAHKSRTKP
jgi:predicted hotdog family 3-hydroxylacyl-ACP dehydratase